MRPAMVLAVCLLFPAGVGAQDIRVAGTANELPAGRYSADPSHTTIQFSVDHLGFSIYRAAFSAFEITADLDPANPVDSRVEAVIPVGALQLPQPPEGFRDTLLGPEWFDEGEYPSIRFVSTAIEMTGETTADIHGELTLHGVTQPVMLAAHYNGGWAGHIYDPNARIGFSVTAEISRTAFGMGFGTPSEAMPGVSDTVHITIETELIGPAWTAPDQD
ncbi:MULTISPECIES: YceI family protein [Hyphobacterium]|uniref:YceI family protein n=1 Tax=Hyphobacterium vulgare TaxID=1736751 RepID=A0ABV7A0W3_9PROT